MKKISAILLVLILLVSGTLFALAADENPQVKAGENLEGDFITGGSTVSNHGIIQGDMIAGAQMLTSAGEVKGDLIAVASDIKITGKVGGSVRVGASNVTIDSQVDRNIMAFAANLVIDENTVIGRNAYLFSSVINCAGTVMGKTSLHGADVTLSGTYEGDVVVNDMTQGSKLNILPGTVIKGKLTYKGVTEYSVPSDVKVGSYEYVRIEPAADVREKPAFDLWSTIRKLFTLGAYYLFALLLYKLFPRFFTRSGDFIGAKPLSAAGIGIATLGILVGGVLFLILLLILVIFLFKGSIFLFAGMVFAFLATITILFADIPVSLWLGSMISGYKQSVPARLAIGLGLITATKLVLEAISTVKVLSPITGFISFILNAGIWILGTGALLKTISEIFKSANRQAMAEEAEIQAVTEIETM